MGQLQPIQLTQPDEVHPPAPHRATHLCRQTLEKVRKTKRLIVVGGGGDVIAGDVEGPPLPPLGGGEGESSVEHAKGHAECGENGEQGELNGDTFFFNKYLDAF